MGSNHSIINQAKLYLSHEQVLGTNKEDKENILSSVIRKQASMDSFPALTNLHSSKEDHKNYKDESFRDKEKIEARSTVSPSIDIVGYQQILSKYAFLDHVHKTFCSFSKLSVTALFKEDLIYPMEHSGNEQVNILASIPE